MNEFVTERKIEKSAFNFSLADLCNQADLAYLSGVHPLEWHVDQIEVGVITFSDPVECADFNIPAHLQPVRHDDSGYAFTVDGEEISIEFFTKNILKLNPLPETDAATLQHENDFLDLLGTYHLGSGAVFENISSVSITNAMREYHAHVLEGEFAGNDLEISFSLYLNRYNDGSLKFEPTEIEFLINGDAVEGENLLQQKWGSRLEAIKAELFKNSFEIEK